MNGKRCSYSILSKNYGNKVYKYNLILNEIVQGIHLGPNFFRIGLILDSAIATPPTTGLTYKVHHLSLAMIERGDTYTFYICNRNFSRLEELENYKLPNIKVHIIDECLFYNAKYMTEVISRDKIDVMQFEVPQTFLDIGIKIRNNTCLPIVLVLHDLEDELMETLGKNQENELLDYIHYTAGHLADSVLTLTNTDKKKRIHKHNLPEHKLFTSPMGIDKSIAYHGPNTRDNIILFAGNQFHEPNSRSVQFLIDSVLPKVKEIHPNTKIKIIGMGPKEFQESYRGDERIVFTGEIKKEADYLYELSTGALGTCCVDSGCGMNAKITSYGAIGLPIILTPICYTGYEKITSLIVVDFDAEQIAREIIKLLSDKDKAKEIGRKNRELMHKYLAWQHIACNMEQAVYYAYRQKMEERSFKILNVKPLWLSENRHSKEVLKGHYILDKGIVLKENKISEHYA